MRVNKVRDYDGPADYPAPEWFYAAMRAIKRVEPDTYARMIAADWNVTVVTQGADELLPLMTAIGGWSGEGAAHEIVDDLNAGSFGVTIPDTPENHKGDGSNHVVNDTWLNAPLIEGVANDKGFDLIGFAGQIIVHEFNHHEGTRNESPAYDAGTAFSRKFGDLRAARSSEDTKRYIVENGRDRMTGPDETQPTELHSLEDLLRLLSDLEGMRPE